jgi:hypothetical protein
VEDQSAPTPEEIASELGRIISKVQEEIDQDGDGVFEKVIKFDEYENPLP